MAKMKHGWFLFTAEETFFVRKYKKHGDSEPPTITEETARFAWTGRKWPNKAEKGVSDELRTETRQRL